MYAFKNEEKDRTFQDKTEKLKKMNPGDIMRQLGVTRFITFLDN